ERGIGGCSLFDAHTSLSRQRLRRQHNDVHPERRGLDWPLLSTDAFIQQCCRITTKARPQGSPLRGSTRARLDGVWPDCRLVASGCLGLRFLSDFAQVAFGATALDTEKSGDFFHPFIVFRAEFTTRAQDLVDQLVGLLTAFDIGR